MKQIQIVPIFDQSAPSVWSNFVDIKHASLRRAYGFKYPSDARADDIEWLRGAWGNGVPHFAFGAYDRDKMVGFIRGGMNSRFATVHELYVLPGYLKSGVGTRLLTAAERAASIVTDDVQVTALNGATSFYMLCGYSSLSPRDRLYGKNVHGRANREIVPVFWCTDRIAEQCQAIAGARKFDVTAVNEKHLPMFVLVNANSGIDGYVSRKESDIMQAATKYGVPHEAVCRMVHRVNVQKSR